MALRLGIRYRSAGDFARHLKEHVAQGALLFPQPEGELQIQQYQPVELVLSCQDDQCSGTLEGEVLQVISNLGVVVKLTDLEKARYLVNGVEPVEMGQPPVVVLLIEGQPTAKTIQKGQHDSQESIEQDNHSPKSNPKKEKQIHRGSGPLSWPFERLHMEWGSLSVPEKVRVAKYGKRAARGMILNLQDKMLHNVLLTNPRITAEEVAAMVKKVNLDPTLLRRIAASHEWTRHKNVAKNLVCHPKLSIPQIKKLLRVLDDNELRRLTRAGMVRASVKQAIFRHLEGRMV